ncbi:hypothetical protein Tco_0561913 [Tanacetum coccineum]
MTEELRDIYRALESRYAHEGRTIDQSFYEDFSDASMAKSTNIGICLYSNAWGLDELEKTLEQIPPYNSRLPAIDDIRNLIHQRTTDEKINKEGKAIHKLLNQIKTNELFDHLRPLKMSSLKAKQPKKPPPKRTRNVGKSKHVELTTTSSTESYSRALSPDPNMSKEQKETRGMFKNLGRALHEFAKMLKKGCR